MMQTFKLATAAILAVFFMSPAMAQNTGTVTSRAFAVGKGPGTNGFDSVLCTQAQIAIGQNAAKPICAALSGDITMTAAGVTAIGASKVTNAQLATMAAFTFKGNATGSTANPTDISIPALTTKASPTGSDYVLISDQAASGALKKAAYPTTGGLTIGSTPITGGTTGRPLYDNGGVVGEYTTVPPAVGGSGANNATNSSGDLLASNGANGNFVATSLNALCSLVPSVCSQALGYTSIAWYGAKCDGIFQSNQNFDAPSTNLSITSGQTLLTSSGSTFTSADVGKRIYIPGAGAAGAALSTTIASFVGATQVNIAVAASTTITTQAATNTAPFAYGTDDTTAIQNAINGTPTGGKLRITGQNKGCVIRQQGANTYALLQNRPFNIEGNNRFSTLMTFPDIPSTVDDLLVDGSAGFDWTGTTWSNFSIGMSPQFVPPTFLMYKRYGKRGVALVDVPAANFVNVNINNLFLGESGNDHSLYIGNATSSASQAGNIIGNRIFGGVHLANVSDSFRIQNNFLYGASTFGGLFEFVSGAGGFNFSNNNVTWTGCTIFDSGSKLIVVNNYFEEVVNASVCARAAIVDFNGGLSTILAPTFTGNIVNASVSTTSSMARFANVTAGVFGDNVLIEGTSRVFINVTGAGTIACTAPNNWNGAGTHFSTTPTISYAGC